jgi:ABC-2 type transport system permease protein
MTLFWNLVFPVFLLVVYKFVFGSGTVDGMNYMTWVVPGVIVFNILSFGMLGGSAFMSQMRESGVLRRLQATPVSPIQLFAAYVSVNLLMCLAQTTLIILFAVIAFQWPVTLQGLLISLPAIVIAVLMAVALGQSLSSVSPKQSVAMAIGQLLLFTQMFIAGLVLPAEMLPTWLQAVGSYLPAHAIGALVRPPLTVGHFGPDTAGSLLIVALYTALASFVATRFFRWEAKV